MCVSLMHEDWRDIGSARRLSDVLLQPLAYACSRRVVTACSHWNFLSGEVFEQLSVLRSRDGDSKSAVRAILNRRAFCDAACIRELAPATPCWHLHTHASVLVRLLWHRRGSGTYRVDAKVKKMRAPKARHFLAPSVRAGLMAAHDASPAGRHSSFPQIRNKARKSTPA